MITISFETFKDMLLQRRGEIEYKYGWVIPDDVWDFAMEWLYDSGEISITISEIVDNIAVNGSYKTFDNLREEDEDLRGFSNAKIESMLEDKLMGVRGDYCIFDLGF